MTNPAESSAQKVLTALYCNYDHEPTRRAIAAAALRAAADEVVPDEGHTLPIHHSSAEWFRFDERKKARAALLAIAAELEAQP